MYGLWSQIKLAQIMLTLIYMEIEQLHIYEENHVGALNGKK